ncbi:M48 family metalloprotease [Priestia megaterium]
MGSFLGKAYSRACEYTCDRIASVAIGDAKAATQALTILAVGHCLNKKVNQEEFVHTHSQEKGFYVVDSSYFNSSPLAHRIKEINYLAQHPELFDLDSNAFQTNEIA